MTVEIATFLAELDPTLPDINNVYTEGDNHFRLTKSTLQNTLKGAGLGFDGYVTAYEVDLNNLIGVTSNIKAQLDSIKLSEVPIGGIIPFNGLISDIVSPFYLCNGLNGTPDLNNMFIYPTATEGELGNLGGSNNDDIIAHNHSATHTHTSTITTSPQHNHTYQGAANGNDLGGVYKIKSTGGAETFRSQNGAVHVHTVSIPSVAIITSTDGVSATNSNIPPYVYLAFMMRTF